MPEIGYRTPLMPRPIEEIEVTHPRSPGAFSILHLSDLHVRRSDQGTETFSGLLKAIASVRADMVAITGDLMDEPGDEERALRAVRLLQEAWEYAGSGRLGAYCVLGNHDTPLLRRQLAKIERLIVPGENAARVLDIDVPGATSTVRLLGLHWPEDPVSAMLETPERRPETFTLALAHHPTSLISLADCAVDLALAGHTHAGQVRLHTRFAPHTSSDLPVHLATGMLRLRDTLMCISRGVGDGVVQGLRWNCPVQVPLYRVRTGLIPAPKGWSEEKRHVVTQVVGW